MKLEIISTKAYTYPGQHQQQGRYYWIKPDGRVIVGVNSEVGDAVPVEVWAGRSVRLDIPRDWTRAHICRWYYAHRVGFAAVVEQLQTNDREALRALELDILSTSV